MGNFERVHTDPNRPPPLPFFRCQHNPCWCGRDLQLRRQLEAADLLETPAPGWKPWTQEAHDRFIANQDHHR